MAKEPIMGDLAINSIAELTRAAAIAPMGLANGNIPFIVIPEGYKTEYLDKCIFNNHAANPERAKGNVKVLDAESFIEYYNLFSDENSRTFADEGASSVVTVLDYHGAKVGAPRWGEHRLSLELRLSEQWGVWFGHNNKTFTQTQFAEFLEQNSMDITKPAPASMVDIARDLEGTTEVQFGGGTRMENGQLRFKYSEETKATVGGGKVDVPDRFIVTIPPYVGGVAVPLEALMRFRLKEGKLSFFYTLVRPNDVLRAAFDQTRAKIAQGLSITIINGKP